MQNCCVIKRLKLYLQTFRKHWRRRRNVCPILKTTNNQHLFCYSKSKSSSILPGVDHLPRKVTNERRFGISWYREIAAHIVIFSGSVTTCFSSFSRPPPKIIWWKDGKKIYDDDNEYHLPREHFNRLLFIDEVSKEHQGNYTCTAVSASEMERVSASTYLTVKGLFWSRLLLLMRGKPVPFSDILSESIKPMN